MSNNLITGGAGFIGSHLTERLLTNGHSVTVVDDLSTGSLQNFEPSVFDSDNFETIKQDVTKPIAVDPEFDVVYHLASIPTPSEYMGKPVDTLRVGSLGTQRALDVAVESNATFFLASTSEVYGDPKEHPQPESYTGNVDPHGPRACYDESKRYAEALTRSYRDEYDLSVRIARIFNTYGPRMRDSRVVPAFVEQALRDRPLTVHGDGSQTRSFCFIDDLLSGFEKLVESRVQEPVNLGSTDEVTINELAEVVIDVCESDSSITYTQRPPDDPEQRRPDITKAKEQLNWEPTTSLRAGLKQTADANVGDMYDLTV